MDTRPSWDEYFISLCNLVASRGTCDRKYVGAVIVKDKRIISTGYNSSIPGTSHCSDPIEFWQCVKCGRKFSEEPREMHGLECAGYAMVKKHGGHDLVDQHCQRTSHSEINAIAQAARVGVATNGATLYCNTRPCYTCFKAIVSAGIKEIVYSSDYQSKNTDKIDDVIKEIPGFIIRQYMGESCQNNL